MISARYLLESPENMVCNSLVSLNVYLVSIANTNMDFTIKCLVWIFQKDARFHYDLFVLRSCVSKNQPFSVTFTFIHRITLSYEWPYSKAVVWAFADVAVGHSEWRGLDDRNLCNNYFIITNRLAEFFTQI